MEFRRSNDQNETASASFAELTTEMELISRSVVLKLVEQSDSPDGREGMSAEFWIAQVKDVFNFLYGRIGLPLELRTFIDALIGASNGKTDWFECSDKTLAVRLIGAAEDGKTHGALKKMIQRRRKKLIEWQRANKYVLVEIDIGYAESARDMEAESLNIIRLATGCRSCRTPRRFCERLFQTRIGLEIYR